MIRLRLIFFYARIFALVVYSALSLGLALALAQDGVTYEHRITTVETTVTLMAMDMRDIKSDVKDVKWLFVWTMIGMSGLLGERAFQLFKKS